MSCMSALAGIKSSLLLTFIDHLACHACNNVVLTQIGEARSVAMHDQYTISYSTWTIKGSPPLSAFCILISIARFVFTTFSPRI